MKDGFACVATDLPAQLLASVLKALPDPHGGWRQELRGASVEKENVIIHAPCGCLGLSGFLQPCQGY